MSTSSLWWWWWLSEMLCALNSLYYFPLSLFALCTLLVILLLPTPVRHCHWLDLTGPHRTKFFPFWTLKSYIPLFCFGWYFLDNTFWTLPSGTCLLDHTFLMMPSGSCLYRWYLLMKLSGSCLQVMSSGWYLLDAFWMMSFCTMPHGWCLLDHAFLDNTFWQNLLDLAFQVMCSGWYLLDDAFLNDAFWIRSSE